MFDGGFESLDDFLGEKIGIGEIVGFFEAFVADPEDIESWLCCGYEFFVIVLAPATTIDT